jgi:hypothetical protein
MDTMPVRVVMIILAIVIIVVETTPRLNCR